MKIRVLILFIFLLFSLTVRSNLISVSPFPLIDQLPSNTIQRVFQDKDGFLWLGTLDGLCRYDAYRLLIFRSDMNNPDLLTNNEITCIAEDKNDNLLVGTKSGLNVLNKKTYHIHVFSDSLMHDVEIKSIHVTKDGHIWVGTTSGAYCFHSDFSLKRQYHDTLPLTSVNSFYEDENGNFWIMLWRGGLFKYDAENDSFIQMPRVGDKNNPFCLHKDSKNRYWLCSWDDGVYIFNPDNDTFSPYEHISIINKEKQSPEYVFFSITEDDTNGYIWLMSNSGLYAFRYADNGSLQEVDISGLFEQYNNIYSEIIKDHAGNLWIATFNEGLLSVNFEKPHIENFAFHSIKEQTGFATNVSSLYIDEDDDIWFRQNRWGLALYNTKENKVRLYQDIPGVQNQEDFNTVNNIYGFRSMPGTIWISIENQDIIYEIKKDKGKIISSVPFHMKTHHPDAGIPLFFYEDRKNNIWIATSTGLFVRTYNTTEIKWVNYSFGTITGITEDTRGNIWVSGKSSGIFMLPTFNGITINESKIEHFTKESGHLISNNIEAICADMSGKVWMGTKEGCLLAHDIVEKSFRDETKFLIFLTGGIHTLTTDHYGHIWILTDKKIIEYNPYNGASRNYTAEDGVLVSSFKEKSFYKDDKSGKLYFGGNKGISVFTPTESLIERQHEIKTIITNIKINNQSVFWSNNNDRFDITTQTLYLEPDDKNIEIDFSSLNYSFSTNIHYAYKMEGVDEDWLYTNNRQYAFYNKLKKGTRRFYIKATDENNLWSPVISELLIHKRPAFYETWWAYIIYCICFIILTYLFYRWINNRIKLRNKLKIAQIEKEKSEELTQTKLRYFTNITHDFLTPLTILSCLIDDAEITHKDKINMFDAMRSNINKLMRLLQQILDFRKIENGKMDLTLSHSDIVKFVRDLCYTNFSPLIKRKKIHFKFISIPDYIPAYFDADKIDKIIYNLLSNAFKYTPDEGIIEVEMEEEVKKESTWIRIKVKDSGAGIDPENLPHIFTRFYNSHEDIAKETNGIGLSLTKELTDLHKGYISVQSEQYKGSVFIVEIPIDENFYKDSDIKNMKPLAVEENATDKQPSNEDRSFAETDGEYQYEKDEQTTLLIVEDNEELLALIRNLMSHHYQVLTASNGREALSVVKENNIDIVISDVMMPEINGLEFCRTIKKDLETSHIPVILLTAKNSVEDRVECYNAGADGYISKPFDLKVLNARIKNFIANKRSKQKEFQEDKDINLSKLEYQTMDEKLLRKAVQIIEENLSDIDFDVITFAETLNMSKSSLYRKLKTITGLSPVEFIRNIRLKESCRRLKDKSVSISEVAYSVGFSDPKYFATCFKNEFNISPSEYQKKS